MTSPSRASFALLVIAALGAVSLTACGAEDGDPAAGRTPESKVSPTAFADRPGGEIVETAIADMGKVRAHSFRGTITQKGDRIVLDVRTDRAGRCAGTMGGGAGTARFVGTRSAVFLKGDTAFWTQDAEQDPSQLLDYLDGRWARFDSAGEIRALCKLGRTMMDEIDTGARWGIAVSDVTRLDGHDVISLSDLADKESAQIVVSVDTPHYIRKIVLHSPGLSGNIVLSGFDSKAPVDVPAAGEYVDLE